MPSLEFTVSKYNKYINRKHLYKEQHFVPALSFRMHWSGFIPTHTTHVCSMNMSSCPTWMPRAWVGMKPHLKIQWCRALWSRSRKRRKEERRRLQLHMKAPGLGTEATLTFAYPQYKTQWGTIPFHTICRHVPSDAIMNLLYICSPK